ncbi:MAG: site-specific DNA-methyltransferase [Acidimicrobiales bacterium]
MSTDQPERLDLKSAIPTDDRFEVLRVTFPEVLREGKVDVDALRRSLGDWVDPGPERFGLTWPGKAECMRVIQEPSVGTLVPMPEESVDWDTTQNVIIEGENLEVLKLLQKAYYGKVKLIYIDPPYNTGKEFIYPDNFREGLADYLRYSGQVDEEGFKLSANAETDGRYHSKWLSMMYPRLFLARNLLREDGFIFVSIDDHEVHNLRLLMNEVFGEENFVACMVWQGGRKNDSKLVSSGHDYIVIFARNLGFVTAEDMRWQERKEGLDDVYEAIRRIRSEARDDFAEGRKKLVEWFRSLPDGHASKDHSHYSYIDERGAYYHDNISSPNYRENLIYDYSGYKPPDNGWRYERATMDRLFEEGRLAMPEDKSKRIAVKRYLHETETWAPPSVFYRDRRGARRVVETLLGLSAKGLFDFPKDHGVLGRLIATVTTKDDLILDFFAGSGSTAHAAMAQNDKDGQSRRFALVQLPETVDNSEYPTIAAITRQRVGAAGDELRAAPRLGSDPVDTGFRSFRLSRSNFTIWNASATSAAAVEEQLAMSVEHIVEGAAEHSMLTELLLKAGYPLTSPVEEVDFAGVPGYVVAEGALLVCLSSDLSIEAFEAMVEREPAMILVLDAGFGGSDELKVNALQTVRARNQLSGGDIALRVV